MSANSEINSIELSKVDFIFLRLAFYNCCDIIKLVFLLILPKRKIGIPPKPVCVCMWNSNNDNIGPLHLTKKYIEGHFVISIQKTWAHWENCIWCSFLNAKTL